MSIITEDLFDDDKTRDILIDIIFSYFSHNMDINEESLNQIDKLKFMVKHLIDLHDTDDVTNIFKGMLGIDINATDIKKIVFEKYLRHEGFNSIKWVSSDETDLVFKECRELARNIAIKHSGNIIAIVAPFYSTKTKRRCMENDRYQWRSNNRLTGTMWLYDVYIYDSKETTFDDLLKFLNGIHVIRWNSVN